MVIFFLSFFYSGDDPKMVKDLIESFLLGDFRFLCRSITSEKPIFYLPPIGLGEFIDLLFLVLGVLLESLFSSSW